MEGCLLWGFSASEVKFSMLILVFPFETCRVYKLLGKTILSYPSLEEPNILDDPIGLLHTLEEILFSGNLMNILSHIGISKICVGKACILSLS